MMPETVLHCDQAIFTSVRTPMGEGYRIIAASKGVKPREKQGITRNSPSHEALCDRGGRGGRGDRGGGGPPAAAFYPLESGRRCVSISFFAGAEQTGRGGQRVYTHLALFGEPELVRCGFNPFCIVRALVASVGFEPQLHPPIVLPALDLTIGEEGHLDPPPLSTETRMGALYALFNHRDLVIAMPDDWLATTEALWLGLPGSLRAEVSFGAGLHFSLARLHRLNLLSDEKGKAKLRTTGQPVVYLNTESADGHPTVPASSWLAFVERCYATGNMSCLRRRTSRAYSHTTLDDCDRVGTIFEAIDGLSECDSQTMLSLWLESSVPPGDEAEAKAREELVEAIKSLLPDKIRAGSPGEACRLWEPAVAWWRGCRSEAEFAQRVLTHVALRIADQNPVRAAQLMAEVAVESAPYAQSPGCQKMFDSVLSRLLQWLWDATEAQRLEATPVIRLWQKTLPSCEMVKKLGTACNEASVPGPTP